MATLRFVVPGKPVAKSRPRLGMARHKTYAYTPKRTKDAEASVGWAARSAGARPGTEPVAVRIVLYVMSGPHEPDADNAAKLVLDGCNGIAWSDDRQVMALVVSKRYVRRKADERTEVSVRRIERRSA